MTQPKMHPTARQFSLGFSLIASIAVAITTGITPFQNVAQAQAETTSGICGRTEEVRTAILSALQDRTDCADVTDADLSGIERIRVRDADSLQSGGLRRPD